MQNARNASRSERRLRNGRLSQGDDRTLWVIGVSSEPVMLGFEQWDLSSGQTKITIDSSAE